MDGWQQDTTVLITAGGRHECLADLLASIDLHWPDVAVHVADDSLQPLCGVDVARYDTLPYDAGLSAKRNHLVAGCPTPYCLLLDDDMLVGPKTRVSLLHAAVACENWDLAGGAVDRPPQHALPPWRGRIAIDGGTCHLEASPAEWLDGLPRYELIENFFLARTEALRRCPWDPVLKIGEHFDWCLRAKYDARLRMTCIASCRITDRQAPGPPQYTVRRRRAPTYARAALKDWGARLGFTRLANHFYPQGSITVT